MDELLTVLAIFGFLVAARGMGLALVRLLGRAADAWAARAATQTRARRGDLTGMAEAGALADAARGARRRALFGVALWGALLAVPPATPWTAPLYASYTALLLLPRLRT